MTETRDQPDEARERDVGRLLKYLPILAVGHLFVTIPTFVISLALAYATFVQAEATRKIQQSESWPFLSYGTSNVDDNGVEEISLSLGNDGVGPARVKATEIRYGGKPMRNPRQFLQSCCGDNPARPTPFMSSPTNGVLRSGEVTRFIRLPKRPGNEAVWAKLEQERWKLVVRSCYCSIFDDCWVLDSRLKDPTPVEVCPGDWTAYEEMPFRPRAAQSSAR